MTKDKDKTKYSHYIYIGFMCFVFLVLQKIPAYADERVIIFDDQEHIYENTNISIRVNGEKIQWEGMYPVVIDGRTLVPVREVMESDAIGASVEWIPEMQGIIITKEDFRISMKVGESVGYIGKEEKQMDTQARLIQDKEIGIYKTMVPIRFITESLGYDVEWDPINNEVLIHDTDRRQRLMSKTEGIDGLKPSTIDIQSSLELKDKVIIGEVEQETIEVLEASSFEPWGGADAAISNIVAVQGLDGESAFQIIADKPFGKTNVTVTDSKVIIDIEKMKMGDFSSVIRMDEGPYVSAVRSSQYSYEPLTARFVFDLYDNAVPKSIVWNDTGTKLTLSFNKIGLSYIEVSPFSDREVIKLKGNYTNYNAFRGNHPTQLIFDFYDTISLMGDYFQKNIDSNLIQGIELAQMDSNVTRMAINTKTMLDFDMRYDEEEDMTLVSVKPLLFDQIYTDYTSYPMLVIPKTGTLKSYDKSRISIEQDYKGFDTIINFHQVVDELMLDESYFIGDAYFNFIHIQTDKNNSVINLGCKHIVEYGIEEDENNIYIKFVRPRERYEKMVLIDIGHGGKDPGASYHELNEKDVNFKIFSFMKEYMENRQTIRYFYTRLDDRYLSLPERVAIANDLEVDLMVSIHNNAVNLKNNPLLSEIRGLEVLITKGKQTSEREKIFAETTFSNFEAEMEEILLKDIRDYNKLYLLRYTDMPAVIIEYGYMTNPQDAQLMKNDSILQKQAQLTEKSIYDYLFSDER